MLVALAAAVAFTAPAVGAEAAAPRASARAAHPHRTFIPLEGSVSLRRYRPKWFTLSGDCGWWDQGFHWTRWTHRKAVGRGVDVKANGECKPVHKRRVVVTFSRPRRFCGHYVFTRVRYVFPHDRRLNWSGNPIYDRSCR